MIEHGAGEGKSDLDESSRVGAIQVGDDEALARRKLELSDARFEKLERRLFPDFIWSCRGVYRKRDGPLRVENGQQWNPLSQHVPHQGHWIGLVTTKLFLLLHVENVGLKMGYLDETFLEVETDLIE